MRAASPSTICRIRAAFGSGYFTFTFTFTTLEAAL